MNTLKLTSYIAIDIGASNGRVILGNINNGILELKEIKRFKNPIIDINGRMYWDLFYLYNNILQSLKEIASAQLPIKSIGIDTWGVDYVCFGKDGELLRMPNCYRDPMTLSAPDIFFNIISKEEVYKKTGVQIMNFNSLFQLFTEKERNSSIYDNTDKILFMPDALSYLLSGKMVTEYTIASTSQFMNPYEKEFEPTLLDSIGLSKNNFAPIVFPGTPIAQLSGHIKKLTGLDDVSVIAVAGHDTASAILATPAIDEYFAYLSSGTWSLMGIEIEKPLINDKTCNSNFTNEAGADGSIRLLKNICGMWLIEQCKMEWEKKQPITYDDIVNESKKASPFQCFINPDSPCFASPSSMIGSIQEYCNMTDQYVPKTLGEIARCIFESLAFRYKQVFENLHQLTTKKIETLHIIGGGSKNKLLNGYTANAIGLPVIAGPTEATAIGNILLQAKADGLVKDKSEMRNIVRNSVELETYLPIDSSIWNYHYIKYLSVFNEI